MNGVSTAETGHVEVVDQQTVKSSSVGNSRTSEMATPGQGGRRMFITCFLGIFVSYFVYGILQEKITRGSYGDGEDAEMFTYTLSLVFTQCVINCIFAQFASQWFRPERPIENNAPQKYYAVMAFSYLGAMVASNQALQYVAYPTQVLGKSAKPIPVMLLGVLIAQKRYLLRKYFFILMIVLGVALFMYKDKSSSGTEHTLGYGEVLLLVSLLLDGVTGGVQDKLRADHRPNAHRMMLNMNMWSVAYLGVALVGTGEGGQFISFASRYPGVLLKLVTFSVCSAIGQNFIFLTVTTFGPLTCSIFTTTRKFFTILGSVIIFQNPMSSRQWLGTSLVFVGLTLDSLYGKDRKVAKQQS